MHEVAPKPIARATEAATIIFCLLFINNDILINTFNLTVSTPDTVDDKDDTYHIAGPGPVAAPVEEVD